MSDKQVVIITCVGLNEQFEVSTTALRPINLASELEKGAVFLIKRFLDDNYNYDHVDKNKHCGFSVLEKEIMLISHNIAPRLFEFSRAIATDDYDDEEIGLMVADRSGEFKWLDLYFSVTTMPADADQTEAQTEIVES